MQKYQLAIPAELEAAELRELERRTDLRLAQQRAQRAEEKLRRERQKAKQELWGMAAFVSVIALALVVLIGVTAAFHELIGWPAGLVVAGGAVGGILLIMRKVGWLKNG